MAIKLKAGQFFGDKSEVFASNGFAYSESLYQPTAQLPTHAHELAHFCLVIAGSYVETIGSKSYDRVPMSLVYYPTDVSHSEKHLCDGRHFLIEIQPAALQRVREYGADLDSPVSLDNGTVRMLAMRMYREYSEMDDLAGLALESISNELLISASRRNVRTKYVKPPRWLVIAKEYLAEAISAPTLNELAAVAGVHPTHLAREFRRFENCTVGDFIRGIRVERAKSRLLKTDQTLVQIALDTGFADQSHFCRSFKMVTGWTPTQFRNSFK